MTREEEILDEAGKRHGDRNDLDAHAHMGFVEGAKWADEHPRKKRNPHA